MTIAFTLPGAADVKLSIHDMLGREVSVLLEEKREAGAHEVTFDGSGLSSGVYICRLRVRPSDSAIGTPFGYGGMPSSRTGCSSCASAPPTSWSYRRMGTVLVPCINKTQRRIRILLERHSVNGGGGRT